MAEDPGSLKKPVDDASGVSELLEAFERAPSEYAQAVIIDEKLVPRIQNHGIHPLKYTYTVVDLHLFYNISTKS